MTRNARSDDQVGGRSILSRLLKSEDGSILPIFAVSMVPMIGAIGLSVDMGRAADMHSSLQATVDKAALSAAASAFGGPSAEETPTAIGQAYYRAEPLPVWTGLTPASTAVSIAGANPNQVTVVATSTAQIKPSFLSIWFNTITVSAYAKVQSGAPSSSSNPFPFAVPDCVLTSFVDANGALKTGPSNPFTFDSANHPVGSGYCNWGQWTSLSTVANGAAYVKDILDNTCNCTVNLNDTLYIQTGEKASLYGDVNTLYADANADSGETVLMPVAQGFDLTLKASYPISSYVPFHITSADQSKKTITGYFVADYRPPNAGGTGGVYYGAFNVEMIQ